MAKSKYIEGKTKTGFQFKLDEEARDDMEILENLTALSKGDMTVIPATLVALLGEDQKKRLYEHCRGKSGRVSSKRVLEEVDNIFEVARETENDTKN